MWALRLTNPFSKEQVKTRLPFSSWLVRLGEGWGGVGEGWREVGRAGEAGGGLGRTGGGLVRLLSSCTHEPEARAFVRCKG